VGPGFDSAAKSLNTNFKVCSMFIKNGNKCKNLP
jgi:hypothetical protein